MAAQHEEIRLEIDQIEKTLESYAQAGAVTPPPGTLTSIKERIDSLDHTQPTIQHPASNWTRFLAAASILLTAGCIWLWITNQQLHQDLNALTSNADSQKICCDSSRMEADSLAGIMAFLQDPNTRTVIMQGTDNSPGSSATVLFNEDRQTAFVNLASIPPSPTGKQYQLWALIDGQPVDMGVLPLSISRDQYLVTVPYQATAGGYAVTLEPAGGSVVPTLEAMVMIGMI